VALVNVSALPGYLQSYQYYLKLTGGPNMKPGKGSLNSNLDFDYL